MSLLFTPLDEEEVAFHESQPLRNGTQPQGGTQPHGGAGPQGGAQPQGGAEPQGGTQPQPKAGHSLEPETAATNPHNSLDSWPGC